MSDEERLYWIALSQTPGVGALRFHQLLEFLEYPKLSIKDLWGASQSDLYSLIPWKSIREAFIIHRQVLSIDNIAQKIAHHQVQPVTTADDEYPKLLQHIPDKPPVLFVKGSLSKINQLPYGVVGTRKITSYGKFVTQKIVRELVANQCSIISGFMYGVDAMAHQTTIEANGYTVGVLGFGFDHMYPPNHDQLATAIIDSGGALVTEYYFDKTPHPGNFPARNRIVAGLSLGIIVTEAAAKSGSKITAQFAGEYGRDVFAVPGAITSQYSDGTKDLINEGAKLIHSAEDILQEMQGIIPSKNIETILEKCATELDKQIIQGLGTLAQDFDELTVVLNIQASELATRLSMLELQGLIVQEQGKYTVNF